MATLFRSLKRVTEKYPVVRGMIAYSVLWPSSNLVQQSIDKTRDHYDLVEALRYLVIGGSIVAPTLNGWAKIIGKIVPGKLLRHTILKVGVCFWPIVQIVNYMYVPLKNRVVMVAGASAIWTIILSYMHHVNQEKLLGFLNKKTHASANGND